MTAAGKTALVTGGSRGLGRAIAARLSGDGMRVYAGHLRDAPPAPASGRRCGEQRSAADAGIEP